MDTLTILGLSKTGAAVARVMQPRGVDCLVSDGSPNPSSAQWLLKSELESLGVSVELGAHSERCLTHSDTVVLSPGIPPQSDIIQRLTHANKHLISEIELAWQLSQQSEPPLGWVGITGTNGKTTTTRLIAAILTHAGYNAPACGNIGLPAIETLDAEQLPDTLVAELSSYQLAYTHTLKAKVAVFLNLTPDHLEWHGGLTHYEAAKARLFTGENSPEWAVMRAGDPAAERIAAKSNAKLLWFSTDADMVADQPSHITINPSGQIVLTLQHQALPPVLNINLLQLRGAHNLENVLAAVAATALLGVAPHTIAEACYNFVGVEHRLEKVKTVSVEESSGRAVVFYNDSKATNPEATLSALRAFKPEDKVLLLAGGRDKNGPLDEFVREVQARVAAVWLFGEAKDRFAQALMQVGYRAVCKVNTLEEALTQADDQARQAPDLPAIRTILLSPACASFDQFTDFEARGQAFKAWVKEHSL